MKLDKFYNSFKEISKIVKFEDIEYLNTNTNQNNESNDIIKQIDIVSNNIIIKHILYYEEIIGYISEEEKELKMIKEPKKDKKNYVISFDPLDGSKNIASNITVGSIYCVFKYDYRTNSLTEIVEAGYCLYGPKTILVKTNNKLVETYTLNKNNEFIKGKNIRFDSNTDSKLYAINTSNRYSNEINQYITYLNCRNYNQRWIGAMVADCHQILVKGGIFLYPESKKYPNGKLRTLYEGIPFSYIFHCAGGIGVNCNYTPISINILNVDLNNIDLHKPKSIILASMEEYNIMKDFFDLNDNMKC